MWPSAVKTIFTYVVVGCAGCTALTLFLMMLEDRQSRNVAEEFSGSNQVERIAIARNPGRIQRASVVVNTNGLSNASVRPAKAIPDNACRQLVATLPPDASKENLSQMASDKNQVMDELLNQDQIPADYGTQMVALFRDIGQDVLTRDFAVQHIGLYAQALNRRGIYDPASAEARTLRMALDEAASDTKTIIAAAAFRALADVAAFDPHVDARRLDARIAACAGDVSAAPAARVMAVHLCGERRVVSARATLASLADAQSTPTPLRLAARASLRMLSSARDGNVL